MTLDPDRGHVPIPDAALGDMRKGRRFSIPRELRGEVMIFQPIVITGISLGGVEVESSFALQPNSLHDFRLSLDDRSVVVKGRVTHCVISDVDPEVVVYRSGIEFIELSDHTRIAIAEFIGAIADTSQIE